MPVSRSIEVRPAQKFYAYVTKRIKSPEVKTQATMTRVIITKSTRAFEL